MRPEAGPPGARTPSPLLLTAVAVVVAGAATLVFDLWQVLLAIAVAAVLFNVVQWRRARGFPRLDPDRPWTTADEIDLQDRDDPRGGVVVASCNHTIARLSHPFALGQRWNLEMTIAPHSDRIMRCLDPDGAPGIVLVGDLDVDDGLWHPAVLVLVEGRAVLAWSSGRRRLSGWTHEVVPISTADQVALLGRTEPAAHDQSAELRVGLSAGETTYVIRIVDGPGMEELVVLGQEVATGTTVLDEAGPPR
ncbi:MAG: hypothetical protein CMH83_18575 [Nocardioides sp.]|nr:hypothetical protein [Nocardioides sp.]